MMKGMDNFEILRSAGYTGRQLPIMPFRWWMNKENTICFEDGAVEDADEKWLAAWITEEVQTGDCVFYFAHGSRPSEEICDHVLAAMKLPKLRTDIRLVDPARR
jgi:hypothetical protein